MAYARWSDGDWYVFWVSSDARNKNQEVLACWHVDQMNEDNKLMDFSYLDAKAFFENPDWSLYPDSVTDEEKSLLLGYIQKWLKNVDKEWREKRMKRKL